MPADKTMSDHFLESIKQQLFEMVLNDLRPTIAKEIYQRRLTVPEASKYTGISEDTIYTLCREKKIPHYRAGAANSKKPKIFFRIESLDKWMEQQERENCPSLYEEEVNAG
ncbi:DNA binding domain-containing protein, excisionase family [Paenibacillus tianmuensis]|uniref:DNA binding domain-containing protein, excisionase family n=1 Tax=Paenibacillus tianmuensis TaxID=624147 RepID=A0A1G4Q6V7_9BACL|nr:helix-turn-helix domain-containing protein [Paenibacillus tianmuensis]SCW40191.1 DNA binding domain-containing protein, excisionase family [Paenibacillus tianmuensis]